VVCQLEHVVDVELAVDDASAAGTIEGLASTIMVGVRWRLLWTAYQKRLLCPLPQWQRLKKARWWMMRRWWGRLRDRFDDDAANGG